MKIELECKIPIPDRAALADKLSALGAERESDVRECNWVFDTPERTLRDGEKLLRMRTTSEDGAALVTVKTPAPEASFKCRNEIEIEVESPRAMEALLTALDYEIEWYYEKKREHWIYEGCEISLDELPEIGCFIEVEGPDEASIARVLHALDVDPDGHVDDTYRGIYRRHLAARGEPERALRFENAADHAARPGDTG
jgi:adenylate cyclase, class 2